MGLTVKYRKKLVRMKLNIHVSFRTNEVRSVDIVHADGVRGCLFDVYGVSNCNGKGESKQNRHLPIHPI